MNPWPGFGPDTTSTLTAAFSAALLGGLAGVAVVEVDVADGGRDSFGLAQQCRQGGPVLCVGWGDNDRNQHAGGVNEDVAFDAVGFVGAVEPAWTGDRGRLDRR
jgi:hypothetical protein